MLFLPAKELAMCRRETHFFVTKPKTKISRQIHGEFIPVSAFAIMWPPRTCFTNYWKCNSNSLSHSSSVKRCHLRLAWHQV